MSVRAESGPPIQGSSCPPECLPQREERGRARLTPEARAGFLTLAQLPRPLAPEGFPAPPGTARLDSLLSRQEGSPGRGAWAEGRSGMASLLGCTGESPWGGGRFCSMVEVPHALPGVRLCVTLQGSIVQRPRAQEPDTQESGPGSRPVQLC